MPVSVATRPYNGPEMTSNATAIAIAGDLEATQTVDAVGLNVTTDLAVGNAATVDTLYANSVAPTHLTSSATNVAGSISTHHLLVPFNVYARNHDYQYIGTDNQGSLSSTTVKRVIVGSVWLGNTSSVTIQHNWDLWHEDYTVFTSICDAGNTTQVVTPVVSSKGQDSFVVTCMPENTSETASISFMMQELGARPPV